MQGTIKSIFFKYFFPYSILLLGMISLCLLLEKKDVIFSVYLLEAIFMFYAFAAYVWTKNPAITVNIAVRWICFFYILISYMYAVLYKERNVLDFLLIYKSFVYIYFLTFLTHKKLISFKATNNLFIIISVIFLLKYIFQIVLAGVERPTLFMENNFELMFIYALYLIRYSVTKDKYLQLLALAGLITIVSLSRSSLLMYSILVLFVIYDSFKKTRVFIIPGAVFVLGGIVFYIFSQRSTSLENVDRYRFMLLFWANIKDWNILQWFVGSERITPLSAYSCEIMSYFKLMFSYSGDGSCYSVVLHSFLFRVIYDHGIIGLIFILGAVYMLLKKSKLRKDVILVFISIVVINGLSVSSFNNLFFAISMLFLMTTNLTFIKQEEEFKEVEDSKNVLNKAIPLAKIKLGKSHH